jgi:hypothetical protein
MTTVHTFRMPFWQLLIAMLVVGQAFYWALLGITTLVDVIAFDSTFLAGASIGVAVLTSLICSVIMVPAAAWVKFALPVRVSADGFTCPNGFGKLVTVPWESIRDVRPFTVPGLPYLVVKTDRTRFKLWLPLFMREMPELIERVEQFAGADHLLYQALWSRVEPTS